MKANPELDLRDPLLGYEPAAKDKEDEDFIRVVCEASNFDLLKHLAATSEVITVEHMCHCDVDRDVVMTKLTIRGAWHPSWILGGLILLLRFLLDISMVVLALVLNIECLLATLLCLLFIVVFVL